MKELIEKIKNVDFEITFGCNLNCLHCYNETHKVQNELSTQKILDVIDEVKDVGFKEIHINGGEPLAHQDVVKILERCNTNGLDTLLETNATLLTLDRINEIQKFKNLKIRASLDGSESVHNKIRRSLTPFNVYQTAVNNLVLAKKAEIPIQITTSVNRMNYNHLVEMVNDLFSKDLDDIRLRLSMPSNSGYVHWQILKLDCKKFQEVESQIREIKENYDIKFNSNSISRCPPKTEQKMFITPHGNVKPYPFIDAYAGNVEDLSLREILKNYKNVIYPLKIEKMMTDYLKGLGMVD